MILPGPCTVGLSACRDDGMSVRRRTGPPPVALLSLSLSHSLSLSKYSQPGAFCPPCVFGCVPRQAVSPTYQALTLHIVFRPAYTLSKLAGRNPPLFSRGPN